MARTALPMLELDDPLRARGAAAEPVGPANQPVPRKQPSPVKSTRRARTPAPSTSATSAPSPAVLQQNAEADNEPWRKWGTGSRTATYRLPEGMLNELDERARSLNLPLGLTVAAAVLLLLDQDDHAVIRHVDRVEDARRAAQRAARPVPQALRAPDAA